MYSDGAFTVAELSQMSVRDILEIQQRMQDKAEKISSKYTNKNRKVLETEEYYNGIINVRVGSSKALIESLNRHQS